jgi:hypothetical protein
MVRFLEKLSVIQTGSRASYSLSTGRFFSGDFKWAEE